MEEAVRVVILSLLLILSAIPLMMTGSAQDQPEAPLGWTIGIDTEQDTAPTFELGLDGSTPLSFWIDNANLYEISFEISYDLPFDGTDDGPTSVSVAAQSNKSFDFQVRNVDVAAFAAEQSDIFSVRSEVTAYGAVPLTSGGDVQEAEGNLTIPTVVDLSLKLEAPTGPMNAGTTTALEVTISNNGNSDDSVYKATITDTCPLLEISGQDELVGVAISKGGNLTGFLNVTSSASHPSKTCVIEMAIQSKADNDAGRTVTADSDEVTLTVQEDRGGTEGGGTDSGGDADQPDDGGDIVTDNWTPLWPAAALLSLLFAASFLRRN